MRVVVLLIVAICCVVNSSDITSIKEATPGDSRESDSDEIKGSSEEKNDQQGSKDVKDIKTQSNESDYVSKEIQNKRKEKEREDKRKEKEREDKLKEKEREDKRKEKEREDKRKEKDRKDKRKEREGDKDKRIGWGRKKNKNPSEPKCVLICLLITDLGGLADPLCAEPDGFEGDSKTFDNRCQLNTYNCKNPKAKYKKISDGPCEPICPQVCPFYVKPFCALADGWCAEPQTFGNPCFLAVYNCENPNNQYTYLHDGECITTPAPEPECGLIDCPREEKPLCALPKGFCADPRTFYNKCYLEVYNCFNPNEQYEYFHDSKCLDEPTTSNCDKIVCTKEYFPFCATPDGFCGDIRIFSNECMMDLFNCNNPSTKYKYFHDGECLTNCAAISCSNEGPAICGLPDGFCGPPQTFTNECNLQVYNCFNPDAKYKKFHDGSCIEPITVCTEEYAPVCATSPTLGSKTFSNKCEQDAYIRQHPEEGYTPAYDGECKPTCLLGCPKIYRPVCGINNNGKEMTFSNQCEFEKYNCLNPNDQYTLAYEAECNNCHVACFDLYAPVCSLDALGIERQWSNRCELDSYNCQHPNDQHLVSYEGECHECTAECKEIAQPVCSVDSSGIEKTWPNQCELDSYNCRYPNDRYTFLYEGQCKPKCTKDCPKILSPICATGKKGHTKTFDNECEMNNYNCQHPDEGYIKSYDGRCKS